MLTKSDIHQARSQPLIKGGYMVPFLSHSGISFHNSTQSALLGGSGGMPPPRKILVFRPSEIVSGAVSGQNSKNWQIINARARNGLQVKKAFKWAWISCIIIPRTAT